MTPSPYRSEGPVEVSLERDKRRRRTLAIVVLGMIVGFELVTFARNGAAVASLSTMEVGR